MRKKRIFTQLPVPKFLKKNIFDLVFSLYFYRMSSNHSSKEVNTLTCVVSSFDRYIKPKSVGQQMSLKRKITINRL